MNPYSDLYTRLKEAKEQLTSQFKYRSPVADSRHLTRPITRGALLVLAFGFIVLGVMILHPAQIATDSLSEIMVGSGSVGSIAIGGIFLVIAVIV
jgi:hypothetical protein